MSQCRKCAILPVTSMRLLRQGFSNSVKV